MARPTRGSLFFPVDSSDTIELSFEAFVLGVEPRLRRALAGWLGEEGTADGVAEALAWAWQHWDRVQAMDNPAGYLYRVARTSGRRRKQGHLPAPASLGIDAVEPGLVPALLALPERQRTAVWLVHGCGWTYAEAAEAMEISASAVGTHVSRALAVLRSSLGEVEP